MSEQQLKRGQEIQSEIMRLKSALSESLKCRMFSINDYDLTGSANPFLADLEVKTRSFATNAITAKLKSLETEFKQL